MADAAWEKVAADDADAEAAQAKIQDAIDTSHGKTWFSKYFGNVSIPFTSHGNQKMDDTNYAKYSVELSDARRIVRQRYSAANEAYKNAADKLLDLYGQLYKNVNQKKEEESSLASQAADEPSEQVLNAQKKLETFHDGKKSTVLADIKKAREDLEAAESNLTEQQTTYNLFLNDQGRVIATVEKYQVFADKEKRVDLRLEAHQAILAAIHTSPIMAKLPEGRRNEVTKDVVSTLRELEQVEEKTDELVLRLQLKVDAIQATEQNQTAEIEETLQQQSAINKQLDSLTDTIENNNADLRATNEQFKEDIKDSIAGVISQKLKAKIGLGIIAIIIVILVAVILILINNYDCLSAGSC